MRVKILCGISGSGKSTYIENHFSGALVISADHYFMKTGEYKFDPSLLGAAHNECLKRFMLECQFHNRASAPLVLVVDNTNTSAFEVAPYYRVAEALGCDVEVIIIDADLEKAAARNVHGVPRQVIRRQYDRLMTLGTSLSPWWKVRHVPAEGL
jgi:predicted kinase